MKAQTNTVERAGAEQQRLAEAREQKIPWKKWGPYLERAPVGHRARGLQRGWKCLGLLQP